MGMIFMVLFRNLNCQNSLNIRFIFPHAPIRPVTLNQGTKMRAWYDIVTIDADAFEDESGIRTSEKLIVEIWLSSKKKKVFQVKILHLLVFLKAALLHCNVVLDTQNLLLVLLLYQLILPLANTLPSERTMVNQEIPVFIAHGVRDEVIPIAWARNSRQILKQHGYTTEWHEYVMGHSVCPEEIRDIAGFLERIVVIPRSAVCGCERKRGKESPST